MNTFINIDRHLSGLAKKLSAKLSVDRPNYPESLRTFEERRIDWIENGIHKAIIIQPKFTTDGVDSEKWTLTILAWDENKVGTPKNTWVKNLIKDQNFSKIEGRIVGILESGVKELSAINYNHLEQFQGIYLFLDLDGVLITTPSWKSDEIHSDGYSGFNQHCVANLNKLLAANRFQIWLTSSRRKSINREEFNKIFVNRNINGRIVGYLPVYADSMTRKEEIIKFISEREVDKFIIIDDDKSLNSLIPKYKRKLVLTNYLVGFGEQNLTMALEMVLQK